MFRFVGDFETTVYTGQDHTEVWASALIDIDDPAGEPIVFNSIDDTFNFLGSLTGDIIVYYHNLKFDGSFWMDFLLKKGYKNAFYSDTGQFKKASDMVSGEMSYLISADMGQWYTITFKKNRATVKLIDSLKLLPFKVSSLASAFHTSVKKLDIEYEGFRKAGGKITRQEEKYIGNDVQIVKECLAKMFAQGYDKMTIGSCCMQVFKDIYGKGRFDDSFPNLYEYKIDPGIYGCDNAGEYIRRAYKGGWCYLKPDKASEIHRNGGTYDVNSLYPSVMHSKSGSMYPYGNPTFFAGSIPDQAKKHYNYFFVTINTEFHLKPGMLPTIQIKNNLCYKATEWLATSDVNGCPNRVKLTLTQTDYQLLLDHYDLTNTEILHGCYFKARGGMFDEYINFFMTMKIEGSRTGNKVLRTIAKLFLNNLYGKFATSTDSSYKVAGLENDKVAFTTMKDGSKKPGYIAIGAAITSYARNFTIRAAQKNYQNFIYADTDSIHMTDPDNAVGIISHPTDLCCWKHESDWDEGYFLRQKTYIEHIVKEDCEAIEDPYYSIKAAGMPEKCKWLFNNSLEGIKYDPNKEKHSKMKLTDEEIEWMNVKREITDFNIGFRVPGKLRPRTIPGGVVLEKEYFTIKQFNLGKG